MTVRGGLRRFAVAPEATPAPDPDTTPAAAQEPSERCEMCGTEVAAQHSHCVDIEQRSLMCACRACYLLFTGPSAGGGRFRAVPDRYLHDPANAVTAAEWDGIGIPVNSAFVLRSDDGPAAFYPSPAGATECLLDLDAWAELAQTHPLLAAAEPEVEAILVHGTDDGVETYLVPVDACYELVGTVRVYWQGFDGGAEAHEHVDRFFEQVKTRARQFTAGE